MIRAIIAFLASVLTAVQAFSIYLKGQAICFNNGCAIVDSLTTVSPLYVNITGFVFFQVLFWCLLWGRDGSELWHKFARLLLLAGLCAEAVMVFFQYAIATVFCSYCLVILSFIILLNILFGPRQIFRGLVLYSAVTIACFGLQFRMASGSDSSLEQGSVAAITGKQQGLKLYLFFSSTCSHCEKVIEELQRDNKCTVRFNPIERIDGFSFPGAEVTTEYNPAVNINFMKSLSMKEIPVLVAGEEQRTLVMKGEKRIIDYLAENCRQKRQEDYGGASSSVPSTPSIVPGLGNQGNDACQVGAGDCDTEVPQEGGDKK